MYTEITRSIRVSVETDSLEDQSDPESATFAFSYTITIENLSDVTVQLLERHWLIESGDIPFAEVVGPGVVGEQPELEAGQVFSYTSGAIIKDPFGSMRGTYTFRSARGDFFQVNIPRFELVYPIIIH